MVSKFTKEMIVVAILSLAVITIAGSVQWAKSSLANPPSQERRKRNLKEEVLTVIDAAPDEVDAEKKAARTKKNKRFNKSKRAYGLEEQEDGTSSGTLLESPPPPPRSTSKTF